MGQTELAQRAGVAIGTIVRMESTIDGEMRVLDENIERVRAIFELEGIEFIRDGDKVGLTMDPKLAKQKQKIHRARLKRLAEKKRKG